jgi:hypothetical protein
VASRKPTQGPGLESPTVLIYAPSGASTAALTRGRSPMPTKMVYSFGDGKADGRGEMKNLLGGKGAGRGGRMSDCGSGANQATG